MVETFRLPYRMIESTSAVGPLYWAAFDQDEENPHLRENPSASCDSRIAINSML